MSRLNDPQIQPTFVLPGGIELPGQPISATDYDAWKSGFEAALSAGKLFDGLEDTTLDLVPGSVLYVRWAPYN
jgi:hypothetical protein